MLGPSAELRTAGYVWRLSISGKSPSESSRLEVTRLSDRHLSIRFTTGRSIPKIAISGAGPTFFSWLVIGFSGEQRSLYRAVFLPGAACEPVVTPARPPHSALPLSHRRALLNRYCAACMWRNGASKDGPTARQPPRELPPSSTRKRKNRRRRTPQNCSLIK